MKKIVFRRLAFILVLALFFSCTSGCGEDEPITFNSEVQFNYEGYASDDAEKLKNKILNSKNTEENYKITGKKYYVSSNGDDSNDGLSPKKPFKTLKNFEVRLSECKFTRDSLPTFFNILYSVTFKNAAFLLYCSSTHI